MNVFAICGDSGTGKTTMAQTLVSHLSDAVILECDRYHKWERGDPHWKQFTHLNPDANHLDVMNQDVCDLKKGQSIFRKSYNHKTGMFTLGREIQPAKNIITCGLHTFICPQDLYDVKIFMDTDPILKTQWKISRDIGKRGYNLQQVKQQIQSRQKDYRLYLEPLILDADIIVNFFNESDLYIDSIKGIGRSLKVFISHKYFLDGTLKLFDESNVEYVLLDKSSRVNFWQIDIKYVSYDHIVLCILDVLQQINKSV